MMPFRTLREAPIKKNTRVLVSANFDVAVAKDGALHDFKIREALPTLRFILRRGGRIRLISYRGRPGGRVVPQLTMKPIVERLMRLLGRKIIFLSDPCDAGAFPAYDASPHVLFFENIRFWPGEEENSSEFAKVLSRWGDCYVNEAFPHSHRAHTSVAGITRFLPAFAGLRLEKEVRSLSAVIQNPRHPLAVMLGGAKLETKLPLIRRFLRDADRVFVGGALANTLFAFMGKGIGRSVADREGGRTSRFLKNKKLYLPPDVVVANALATGLSSTVREVDKVGEDEYIVDIGPRSQKFLAPFLRGARTIVWNGPMGYVEASEFAKGTIAAAKAMRRSRAFTVVGGEDTLAALSRYHLLSGFRHVSTGGGAMLAFLAGKKLPGIEALKNSNIKN